MTGKIKIYQPKLETGYPDPLTGDKITVCFNKEWIPLLQGFLYPLLWKAAIWEGTDQEISQMHEYVQKLLDALSGENACSGSIPEGEICHEYAPNSSIITWSPNDPFQTPDLIPEGYPRPPWDVYPFWFDPIGALGYEDGDVVFSYFQDPTDLYEFLSDIPSVIDFINSGFPRFRVRCDGAGTVELHLLKVAFGGLALITIDSSPTSMRTIDLNTIDLDDIADIEALWDLIQMIIGVSFNALKPAKLHIEEIEITEPGEHYVDVTFIPNAKLLPTNATVLAWGGGVRKVVLCHDQIIGVPNQMPQFRRNGFNLEWKPSEIHTAWENLGQVAYPVTMREESQLIQWTLQGIPIGGGADPFQQWIDLLSVQDGENAPTPAFEWEGTTLKIDADGDGIFETTSPNLKGADGQDGENAPTPAFEWEGTTLKIDADGDGIFETTSPNLKGADGADGQDGEDGQGVNQVIAVTLPPGSQATANLVNGVLTIGIPKGVAGDDGQDVTQGYETPSLYDNREDHICGGVNGLIDRIFDVLGGALAQMQADFTAGTVAGQKILNLLELVTFEAVSILPLDEIFEWSKGDTEVEFADWNAALADVFWKDRLKKELFCLVMDIQGDFTPAMWADWQAGLPYFNDLSELNTPLGEAKAAIAEQTLKKLFFVPMARAYKIYTGNADSTCHSLYDCFQNYDWEHIFDFTTEDGDFVPSYSQSGFWIAPIGWSGGTSEADYQWTDGSQNLHYARGIEISKTFAPTTITMVRYTGSITAGNRRQRYMVIDGSFQPGIDESEDGEFIGEWNGEQEISSFALATWTYDNTVNNADPRGYSFIAQCVVRGQGINPFT